MSTAVSVVTCRQAPSRMPLSGCSLAKRSRTWRRTGIDCSAHSILRRPSAARAIFFTSWSTMCRPFLDLGGKQRRRPGAGAVNEGQSDARVRRLHPGVVAQVLHPVRTLPREVGLGAAEVTVGGRLAIDGTPQIQALDDARRREVEVPPHERLEGGV